MFFFRYPVSAFSNRPVCFWPVLGVVAPVLLVLGLMIPQVVKAKERPAPGSAMARVSHEARGSSEAFWTEERIAEAVSSPPKAALETGIAPLERSGQLRHSPPDFQNPAVGKIVYTAGGSSYSCSGTLLESRSRRIVLTAAHCLRYRGVWSSRIRFLPGFDRGSTPYGTWGWKTAWITTGWARSSGPWSEGNVNFDLGLIVLSQRLGDRIDGIEFQSFPQRKGQTRILGYPAGSLAGRELRMCQTSTWAGPAFSFGLPGPTGMAGYCDMAGGSSGGPWLSTYNNPNNPDEPNLILDGVTSTGLVGADVFSSPYLGSQFVEMLRKAQN